MDHAQVIARAQEAMEQALRQALARPVRLELVHISADFAARPGPTAEARVEAAVHKAGRTMAFVGAEVSFGPLRAARLSAVYKLDSPVED